jgi:hypothetical protein
MSLYKLINYDLTSDGESWSVNDAHYTSIELEIAEDESDADIVQKLIECGFATELLEDVDVEIDGDPDYSLYVNAEDPDKGMVPFCELRKVE